MAHALPLRIIMLPSRHVAYNLARRLITSGGGGGLTARGGYRATNLTLHAPAAAAACPQRVYSSATKLLEADPEIDEAAAAEIEVSERYPTVSPVARSVLHEHFGHGSFRPHQEEVIARLLNGGSAIAVFPTGAGKSLLFQVAALALGEGVTVVVSPLVALIKDQVQALQRIGVSAAAIDSTMEFGEVKTVFERVRRDEVRLLYVAPERLNNARFTKLMTGEGEVRVRLVAVDEAHCMFEWGNSFRPEYLRVPRFVKECKAERVLCVTATATPEATGWISKAFEIPAEGLFRTGIYRPNLQLLARSYMNSYDRFEYLLEFLAENQGPGIVYVLKRSTAESLAAWLVRAGVDALPYHAGLDKEARSAAQDRFMEGEDIIIVATVAFGLGINKPNIRKIVHYGPPLSLENYAQEIGRAGRDGLPSKCIILTAPVDIATHDFLTSSPFGSCETTKSGVLRVFRHFISTLSSSSPGEVVTVPMHTYGKHLLGTIKADGSPRKKRRRRKGEEEKYKKTIPQIVRENAGAESAVGTLLARFEVGAGAGHIRALPSTYGFVTYRGLEALQSLAIKEKEEGEEGEEEEEEERRRLAAAVVAVSVRSEEDDEMWMFRLWDVEAARNTVLRQMQAWEYEELVQVVRLDVARHYELVCQMQGGRERVDRVVEGLWEGITEGIKKGLEKRNAVRAMAGGSAGCFVGVLEEHFGEGGSRRECGHCQWCLDRRQEEEGKAEKMD